MQRAGRGKEPTLRPRYDTTAENPPAILKPIAATTPAKPLTAPTFVEPVATQSLKKRKDSTVDATSNKRAKTNTPSSTPYLHYLSSNIEQYTMFAKRSSLDIRNNINYLSKVFNVKNDKGELYLTWLNNKNLHITLTMKKNDLTLNFSDETDKKLFLTFTLDYKSKKITTTRKHHANWTDTDIDSLIFEFNQLLPTTPRGEMKSTPTLSDVNFKKLFTETHSQHVTKRMALLMHHTRATPSITHHCNVTWVSPLNLNHVVRLYYDLAPYASLQHKSYAMSEKQALINMGNYDEKQSYAIKNYHVDICESTEKNRLILNLKMTVNGKQGELYSLHRGEKMTGNEVLALGEQVQRLMGVETSYLQDMAVIEKFSANNIHISMRVVMSIAYGKTWYMKHANYKPVTCQNWQSGWNSHLYYSQDENQYNQAIQQLQSLQNLQSFLPKAQTILLAELIKTNQAKLHHDVSKITLQELVAAVLDTTKSCDLINAINQMQTLDIILKLSDYHSKLRKIDDTSTDLYIGSHFDDKETQAEVATTDSPKPKEYFTFLQNVQTVTLTRLFSKKFVTEEKAPQVEATLLKPM